MQKALEMILDRLWDSCWASISCKDWKVSVHKIIYSVKKFHPEVKIYIDTDYQAVYFRL